MECMKARLKGCSSGGNTPRASSTAEGLRFPRRPFIRKLCKGNHSDQTGLGVVGSTEGGDSGSTTVAGRTRGKTLLDVANLRQMVESKIRKTPNKSMVTGSDNMGFLFA